LNNKNEYPNALVLERHLGDANRLGCIHPITRTRYPLITGEWRYYNDGKSWLFKVTQKKGTICWVSVWDGFFKVTFYYSDKAAGLIAESSLDQTYKAQYNDGKHYGKIRGITVVVNQVADLEALKILTDIKLKIK
jgi:hypothetical protein